MKVALLLFLALAALNNVYSFKVLGILPMGSKSHYAIGSSVVDALYQAGHEVTVITPFPSDKPKENYREVSMADLMKKHEEEQSEKFYRKSSFINYITR